MIKVKATVISSTTAFLEDIQNTLIQGEITEEGYYSYATFKHEGCLYAITDQDSTLKKIVNINGKTDIVTAPIKGCKDGSRPKYTFNVTKNDGTRDQIEVDIARLNAALLIPDCLAKMLLEPNMEINHKATVMTQSYISVLRLCWKAWRTYKDDEVILGESKALAKFNSDYKDIARLTIYITDNFSHAPRFFRDNRIGNLELCTSEENRLHYTTVKEFIDIEQLKNRVGGLENLASPLIKTTNLYRISASKAAEYQRKQISRLEFVNYVLNDCECLSLKDVLEKNAKGYCSDKLRLLIQAKIIHI